MVVAVAFLFGVMGVLAHIVPHKVPDTAEGLAWREVCFSSRTKIVEVLCLAMPSLEKLQTSLHRLN